MTPEQWAPYGGCPRCNAVPGSPCMSTGLRPLTMDGPHAGRPFTFNPATAASLMDDMVAVRVKEGVVVRPGDTLVLRIDQENKFPDEIDRFVGEIEAVRQYVNAMLPRGARCVVVAANGELGVVRGETETAAASGATDRSEPADSAGAPVDLGCPGPPTTPETGGEGQEAGEVR